MRLLVKLWTINFKPETNFCKFALSIIGWKLDKIKEYIGKQAFSTQDKAELEFRIKFLGSKGLLKIFFRVQECS
jgi:hypothetical protein